jgi:hypothetical protein
MQAKEKGELINITYTQLKLVETHIGLSVWKYSKTEDKEKE